MYYYILSLHLLGTILLAGAVLLSLLVLLPQALRRGEWQPLADFAMAFERASWPLFLLMAGSGIALSWLNAANVHQLWDLSTQAGKLLATKTLGTAILAGLWWGWRYRLMPSLKNRRPLWVIAYLSLMAVMALLLSEAGVLYLAGFFLNNGQGL